MNGGISNGACGQSMASRVCRISSVPNGSPCALAVPARLGDPLPIVVRQTIKVGPPTACLACSMAPATATVSCPSIGPMTFQP